MDIINEYLESYLYIVILAWYTFFAIFTIVIYFKHDKENKREFKDAIYKELPKEYGPEVLNYFLTNKIVANSFSASILNLVKKGGLKLEKDNGIFFLVAPTSPVENLTRPEVYLKDFILNRIKSNGRVSLHVLKKLAKDKKLGTYFLNIYENWQESVYYETTRHKRYIGKRKNKKILIFTLIGIIIFILYVKTNGLSLASTDIYEILGGLIFLPAIFISVYGLTAKVKTKEANEDYYKWRAFQNYLKNFTIKNYKGSVSLIDSYLTYSLVLGEEKNFINDILTNKKAYMDIKEQIKINPEFFLEIKSLTNVISRVTRLKRKRSVTTASVRRRSESNKKVSKENQIGDRGIGF